MIYIIFFLFSLGSLGRISFLGQQVNIYLYEIVYALYLCVLVAKHRTRPLSEHTNLYKYGGFFLLAAVTTFAVSAFSFSTQQNSVAILYLARLSAYILGFPYLLHHVKEKNMSGRVTRALLLYIILTTAASIVQYFYYPNLRNLEYLGWDPHQYRMFGTVFDTSTAAALYGVVLLFLIVLGKKYLKPVIWVGSIVVFSVFGALTYSRGFYLSFVVTLIYFLVIKHKRFMSAFYVLLIFGLLLIIIPKPVGESANLGRMFTIQARAADYQKGIAIWNTNPVLGIGYNHLRYVKPGAGADTANHAGASLSSSFLIILVTMGIVGLMGFVVLLYKLSATSQIAFYTLLFLSLFSLADNILLHPFILFMETFIIALGLSRVTSRT
ncbi:O-antigen ligase family protein [Candidatus Microgenomates bacterium]|nr:O-antigen ligase family protein [Candidatus Microgenomates bacterium]